MLSILANRCELASLPASRVASFAPPRPIIQTSSIRNVRGWLSRPAILLRPTYPVTEALCAHFTGRFSGDGAAASFLYLATAGKRA